MKNSVSVVLCTWNRCELLRSTLESLSEIDVPPHLEWELLVVNNNCTDDTDSVVLSFEGRLPVRLLFEPEPGRANALNLAISEVKGELVLFTDDDVLLDRRWMMAYLDASRAWPEAAFFGGDITPWYEGDPPPWFPAAMPEIGGIFGISRIAAGSVRPSDPHLPFGANCAVRTDVLRRHPYDSSVGVRGGKRLGAEGEETVLFRTLLHAGFEGRWIPEARLQHFIPKDRQTLQYLRRFFFDHGARNASLAAKKGPSVLGRPLWMWRQAIQHQFLYWVRRPFARPAQWIFHLQLASRAWGGLFGKFSDDGERDLNAR